ncbi:YchJ family metal-binding protein [Vibrio hannami]|uniref:YchJ family metal-binding protein n=1 Tax=Vibrio hannami TaxID=2717094 RepID=UPI002410AF87|nr:YchJ family metal-binding protein [Vibrio hannami]MDG3087697.1 YchJ family metal-binding protein [Vibrio hannami]
MNDVCPCGSGKSYSQCCELVHHNHATAQYPEQLMRARYSAHVLKLVDFVVNTYHSSCNAEHERAGIEESINLDWSKLEVVRADKPLSDEGFVEFKAYLLEEGIEHCMHELSRFVRDDGLWYYIDGVFPENEDAPESTATAVKTEKVGRNDPCPCGSGKKFKKCCG